MTNPKSVYPVCFWCGDVFSEPVVLGDEFTDDQKNAIPEQCVIHYDPCPKCMNIWRQGRVFIEYDNEMMHECQPCLSKKDGVKFYPTGRLSVTSIEKAVSLLNQYNNGEPVADVEPISFLDKDNFAMMFEREHEICCFWCGQPFDGSVQTVKRLKAVENYEPCNTCLEKWSGVCVLFECDFTSDRAVNGVTVKCDGLEMYPTGRLMRLDMKEAKRLMGSDIGTTVFIPKSKFRILSGEDKPNCGGKSTQNAAPSQNTVSKKKPLVLARNDDN